MYCTVLYCTVPLDRPSHSKNFLPIRMGPNLFPPLLYSSTVQLLLVLPFSIPTQKNEFPKYCMSESTSSYMPPHEGRLGGKNQNTSAGVVNNPIYYPGVLYPAVREALPPFTWAFEKVSGRLMPRTVLISVKASGDFLYGRVEETEPLKGTKGRGLPLEAASSSHALGVMAQGILGLPRLYMIPIQCCIVGFWCHLGGQAP